MFSGPKYIKFKKIKKGKLKRLEFKASKLKFGLYGLKAGESCTISSWQIEAARQAITRKIRRKGKVWIRVFPHLSVTSKPTAVRMGKGKGQVSHWGIRVAKGTILFEVCGANSNIILLSLKTGGAKLPLKTKIFY